MKKKFQIFYFIVFSLFCSAPVFSQPDFAPLFPFLISYDSPDNVTNMKGIPDAPAGKHGFIRIENGRFVTDIGIIRFNGTDLTGAPNFPTYEQADRLAARMARFGINCVRLHFLDDNYGNFRNKAEQGIFANDSTTQRKPDPVQVDLLDYLIAAFKKQGVSSRILLAATGVLQNKNMTIEKIGNKITASNWGTSPVYVEGIPAVITMRSNPDKTKCYALDERGERKQEILVEADNGNSKIEISPKHQTIWYEMEVY